MNCGVGSDWRSESSGQVGEMGRGWLLAAARLPLSDLGGVAAVAPAGAGLPHSKGSGWATLRFAVDGAVFHYEGDLGQGVDVV